MSKHYSYHTEQNSLKNDNKKRYKFSQFKFYYLDDAKDISRSLIF
ncbi:hypothetical protein ACINWC743_A0554 [Acinetobacter sp. WC-743]|nr:hypothetical protein ACINWC743_A0554 [Acinetobacter sp. WC-743]